MSIFILSVFTDQTWKQILSHKYHILFDFLFKLIKLIILNVTDDKWKNLNEKNVKYKKEQILNQVYLCTSI